MKKNKIKLTDIKVESFVTKLNGIEKATIAGEAGSGWWICTLSLLACGNRPNRISFQQREDCAQTEIRSHFAPEGCLANINSVGGTND